MHQCVVLYCHLIYITLYFIFWYGSYISYVVWYYSFTAFHLLLQCHMDFCFGKIGLRPVNNFIFILVFWGLLAIVVLALFLYLASLTSGRGLFLSFGLDFLFRKTFLVFIFVSCLSPAFNSLPFVLTVGVTHNIQQGKIFYSRISKILPLLLSRQWFLISEASKERTRIQKVPDVWTCFSQNCVFDICNALVCWVRCCASCATRKRNIIL